MASTDHPLLKWGVPLGAAGLCAAVAFSDAFLMMQSTGPQERAEATTESVASPTYMPTTTWATQDFPSNSRGLTYGSIAEANGPDEMPDLVAVVGDKGHEGFVYKRDLLDARPTCPADAERLQERQATDDSPVVPVFDIEGVQQIDVFTLYQAP